MQQLSNNPPSANVQVEDSALSNLNYLGARIIELQQSLAKVSAEHKRSQRQRKLVWGQFAYLATCKLLRKIIATTIEMRIGGVLIGAAMSGGLFLVLTLSWMAFFCGFVVGVAVFYSLLYLPQDERIPGRTLELEKQLTDCKQVESDYRRINAELDKAKEEHRQIIESQQYRLQKLLDRNWKAMRGGELEQFLAEVFTELRYSVERTGGAGDQGVDLILVKNGFRIAVQLKGYLDSVPNTAIQEAYTGMTYHQCVGCAVITNSRFTSGGKNVAQVVGCILIDEDSLPKLILGQIDLRQMILAMKG